jgi:Flp pilus assembly protein TadB
MMGLSLPLAAALGAAVGFGLFLAVLVVVGVPPRIAGRPPRWRRPVSGRQRSLRLARGIGFALLTLLLTRWVVAGLAIGALAMFWDRVGGADGPTRVGVARLEALASWTESLRDTIAGAIGLEQAIPATSVNAAPAIRPALNLLVDRLRIREPLPDALLAFAGDLDDAGADVVCAALVLNARLRGPGLRDVLTALAISAREELDMRRRVDASRRSIRRSVKIVLIVVLGVMGLLSVLNRTYVAPYGTLTGQLVLVLVAGLFGVGLLWLRRLAAPRPTDRFLVAAGPRPADVAAGPRPADVAAGVVSEPAG